MTKKRGYLVLLGFIIAGAMLSGIFFPGLATAKTYRLTFSTYWPESYTYFLEPIRSYAKKVEQRTDGRVKIKIYHSGQLYKGKEEFAACERGDIDMTAPLDTYMTGIIPELGISSLPFLWENYESMQRSLDAGLWNLGIKEKLHRHNLELLGVSCGGGYQVYSKKDPVYMPADFKGKIWGVSGSTPSKACKLLGGAPTTMSSGELYMALQRGTIDGCTRPLITGVGRKLYEVAKHLTVTNMYYYTSFLVINKEVFDGLPKDIQKIMLQAGKERDQEQMEKLLEFEKNVIKIYKNQGVQVHFPTTNEIAAFKKTVMPVWDWWYGIVPDGKKYTDFVSMHH